MLGFGGAGGMINMSYQLDTSIHNTQWVTGHFHLIFGGAIVIMYFAIAYDLWPHLTGRPLTELRLMRLQLWLWFIGMIVTSFPWHWVGILGMPRRMAYFDYTDPALQPMAFSVILSAIGGFISGASGILFFVVLIRGQRRRAPKPSLSFRRSRASARHGSCGAQWLRALGGADDRPDRHQLRLSDPAARAARSERLGAGGLCRERGMKAGTIFLARTLGRPQRPPRSGSSWSRRSSASSCCRCRSPTLDWPACGTRSAAPPAWSRHALRHDPVEPAQKASSVVMSPDMLAGVDAAVDRPGRDPGPSMRHLPWPNRHQPRRFSQPVRPICRAIYKQLKDFKTGARVNAVMTPFAVNLSEQDMVDIAAYYAYLPRLPSLIRRGMPAPRIVTAARRCAASRRAARATAASTTSWSPWLGGQSAGYFREQLRSFAAGNRRNDINQQMRNIARQIPRKKIETAASYYASQPRPEGRSQLQ